LPRNGTGVAAGHRG